MKTGILLIQLGTPPKPTFRGLFWYLRQFLSDRRIIEVPKPIWQVILHCFILPFRPGKSAAKYRRVWREDGKSPLLHYTERQTELLQAELPQAMVRFGMQYGQPAVGKVVSDMIASGVDRLIVLPLYPQYSATTTASATDHLFRQLLKERRVPSLRIIHSYANHPGYLDAMATIVKEELAKLDWEPEHFILTFHGIPQRYTKRGDTYALEVNKTTQALVKKLGWVKGKWTRTFQSRFGPQAWLKPYTDDKLEELAKKGIKKVFAIMPGFTSDCLETTDEIGLESLENFEHAGGEHLHACRCLNDHPAWIQGMKQIIWEQAADWLGVTPAEEPSRLSHDWPQPVDAAMSPV
jgi:protoporphyrin/coproporphyrin ferrochelatase